MGEKRKVELGKCKGHWVNGVEEEWGESHTGECGRKEEKESSTKPNP